MTKVTVLTTSAYLTDFQISDVNFHDPNFLSPKWDDGQDFPAGKDTGGAVVMNGLLPSLSLQELCRSEMLAFSSSGGVHKA